MNKFKNQFLGVLAFFFVLVGLTNAAQKLDPSANEVVSQQEIREFAAFCSGGTDPR